MNKQIIFKSVENQNYLDEIVGKNYKIINDTNASSYVNNNIQFDLSSLYN